MSVTVWSWVQGRVVWYRNEDKVVVNLVEEDYSGTSHYGHLTSKNTSPLQSPWLSPKLYLTVQITPCNKVTSPLRLLL